MVDPEKLRKLREAAARVPPDLANARFWWMLYHCDDCGVLIELGDLHCWKCGRVLMDTEH